MRRAASFVLAGSVLSWSASAATVKREQEKADGPATIFVEGPIEFGDDRKFVDQILGLDAATIVLASEGGSLDAGIRIGRAIQLKGFNTLVPDGHLCASSCAFAWLAGQRRFMGPNAAIGFHAAYEMKDGVPTEKGNANAVVGAYLNTLNLPEAAIYFLTSAPPVGLNYLTIENAAEYGIAVASFESPPMPFAPSVGLQSSESAIFYLQGSQGEPGLATEATIAWTEISAGYGPAIRGTLTVPGQGATTTVTIYRNNDSSLPASHLVEVQFSGKLGASSVQRVPALVLKQTEQARGQPLTGAAMPVSTNLFWIALSDDAGEVNRNLQLLRDGSWFDVPILFDDGTRALLTFEKGLSGDQVFQRVLDAWQPTMATPTNDHGYGEYELLPNGVTIRVR